MRALSFHFKPANSARKMAKLSGFTLIEGLTGAFLFAVLSAGLIAGLLQARRNAEINVWQITAATVAQGYLEQIKNMEYVELSYDPIPTKLNINEPDPLFQNVWNEKTIDLYDTPDNEDDDLRIWIRPRLTEIPTGERRYEMILDFRWEVPFTAGREILFEDSLHSIRSYVPSY